MAKDVLEFFKPEIDLLVKEAAEKAAEEAAEKAAEKAAAKGWQRAFYGLVQDGDMTLDRAAKKTGMSPSIFTARMVEAGFTVPGGA